MWLETVYLYHKNGETLMILSNDTVFFFENRKLQRSCIEIPGIHLYTCIYLRSPQFGYNVRANVNKKDTLGIRNNKPDSSSRYP